MDPHARISIEEALRRVLDRVEPLAAEEVELSEALGRVLATDVVSDIDVNPFDNSSMDGYAIRSADLAQASPEAPVMLEVVGYIGAGSVYEPGLLEGQAVRIMTGAPMPEGADAVQKYEDVEVVKGDGLTGSLVGFSGAVKPGQFVRKAGEEFKAGDVALGRSTVVNAYAMGMLASAGAERVPVHRKPKVGVFVIGSELVGVSQKPTRGMIRDSNSWALTGLAREAGAEVAFYGIVPDSREEIAETLRRAVSECDLVVSAGGASQGDFDFILEIVGQTGEVVFSHLSLRPGKRQTFGMVSGVPVFGLSGNPAAASVGFELFIRPALRKLQGFAVLERPVVEATLAKPIKKKEGRAFYNRGRVEVDAAGEWVAYEHGTQSSALLGDLARCNCLIVVPEESMGMDVGERVRCIRIDLPEGTEI